MPNKPVRVVIYLKGSVAEYVDRESGTRVRRERKDFDRMFADAARKRFNVLLFWALDRFSREGIRKTIAYLQRLDDCGVAFKSYAEPFLDADNELMTFLKPESRLYALATSAVVTSVVTALLMPITCELFLGSQVRLAHPKPVLEPPLARVLLVPELSQLRPSE